MPKLSLSERLARYIRNQGDWIASGTLQRLALEAGYTAQNAGRRLRELVEDGTLEVEYRNPHNHAYYRYKPQIKTVERVKVIGDRAILVKETISV